MIMNEYPHRIGCGYCKDRLKLYNCKKYFIDDFKKYYRKTKLWLKGLMELFFTTRFDM